jgi:pimeloyl-ACP methyl ester carboxylesterase
MTYVLIHGAGDSGAAWDLVADRLRSRGHVVVAVDLPSEDASAGLAEYTESVVRAVGEDDARGELVVVGHSLGGFTAPLVADRLGADLLVLASAMVPSPGETGGEWWSNSGHADAFRAHNEGRDTDDELELYLHDVPRELAERVLANGRGQAERPLLDPWPLAAWPGVPTRFVLFRDDRFFPADWTRRMVRERLGIEPDEIDGGHCAYLSRPDELVDRLEDLRLATRRSRSSDCPA